MGDTGISDIIKDNKEEEGASHTSADSRDTASAAPAMVDKSIQIDMDCEPGEDPKKNKKYWQDLAGLRGAREQYLQDDIRDFDLRNYRQTNYINYLKAKLKTAATEISQLKAKQCSCQRRDDRPPPQHDSSMGL